MGPRLFVVSKFLMLAYISIVFKLSYLGKELFICEDGQGFFMCEL